MRHRTFVLSGRSFRALLAATLACAGVSLQSHADVIAIASMPDAGAEGLGSFTGSIEFNHVAGASSAELIITLTNTSDPSNGGYITGFVFNIGGEGSADVVAEFTGGTHPFLNAPNQNAMPFGNPFDAGAALGGNFLGGGNPTPGIGVGQTGVFNFTITGSGLSQLSPLSFMSGPFTYNFIVRFRGFADGGSDKVPAQGTPVPGPAAIAAFAFAAAWPRQRRRVN